MNFVDHTGHIFYTDTYASYPVGYEYETTPYVFWFDSEYSHKLSVNNYYVLPIRIVVPSDKAEKMMSMKVSLDSDVFSLYNDSDSGLKNTLNIDENKLTSEIHLDLSKRITGLEGEANDSDIKQSFDMLTFYVFCYNREEGSVLTNLLIEVTNNNSGDFNDDFNDDFYVTDKSITPIEYTPITVAATFIDESEELIINARNIGVKLPKDIIKAVYQTQYFNDNCDENFYNLKLKEYLINHMSIKSECGNFNSVFDSISWFGWGDKLHLSKLLKTDNEFQAQYVRDYFNIYDDILDSFKYFKNTSYISLHIHENYEGEQEKFDFSADFYGENKPKLHSYFDKVEYKTYDEYADGPDKEDIDWGNSDIKFKSHYYEFMFDELALKLSCLRYMLQKYFLPIHININSASVEHKVFANDIKMIQYAAPKITETPIYINASNNSIVEFSVRNERYIYNHSDIISVNPTYYIVDGDYLNFSSYTKDKVESEKEPIYYIVDEPCFDIPINFYTIIDNSRTVEGYYNATFILSEKGTNIPIYERSISFYQTDEDKFNSICIVPKLFRKPYNAFDWENKEFVLDVLCNNCWYKYEFTLKMPNFQTKLGKLKYTYNKDIHKQINKITDSKIDFNAVIYAPQLVQINNLDFVPELIRFGANNISDFVKLYNEEVRITYDNKYLNRVYIFDIYDQNNNRLKFDSSVDAVLNNSNPSADWIEYYEKFFNKDEEGNCIEQTWCKIDGYDMYLMHDEDYWYIVYISEKTLDNKVDVADIIDERKSDDYKLVFVRSSERFLINRMKFISQDDMNNDEHRIDFDNTDIIVASIENDDFPYVMALGTKWTFIKKSIGGEDIAPVTSKTNAAVMSLNLGEDKHAKGYYDVVVTYSIDDFANHSRQLSTKILVR